MWKFNVFCLLDETKFYFREWRKPSVSHHSGQQQHHPNSPKDLYFLYVRIPFTKSLEIWKLRSYFGHLGYKMCVQVLQTDIVILDTIKKGLIKSGWIPSHFWVQLAKIPCEIILGMRICLGNNPSLERKISLLLHKQQICPMRISEQNI